MKQDHRAAKNSIAIIENVSLAPFTTLNIGGPARFFVCAETEAHVAEAVEFAEANKLNLFVLGGGSNILVSDAGFNGLVVQIALKGISSAVVTEDENRFILVKAQAGEDWDKFVQHCVENELAGVECLSGIPGFVGGTPVQNVGAYGQEVSETINSVRCYDRKEKKIVEMSNAECGFAYRTSIFNTIERDRYIVLAVLFRLEKGGMPSIIYPELKKAINESVENARMPEEINDMDADYTNTNIVEDVEKAVQPTLKQTREAVLTIRRRKSMVIDENDPNSKSAGSFFKNPIVSNEMFGQIAASESVDVPSFRVDDEFVKIPAAWLIERSGFQKGYRLGNAGISTKHSLAIINPGGATAEDILALKNSIQSNVEKRFGITLTPEPVFVGC